MNLVSGKDNVSKFKDIGFDDANVSKCERVDSDFFIKALKWCI